MNSLPRMLNRLARNAVNKRQWIYLPATPLIHAPLQEHRVAVGSVRQIRSHRDGLNPCLHGACLFRRSRRKYQLSIDCLGKSYHFPQNTPSNRMSALLTRKKMGAAEMATPASGATLFLLSDVQNNH